MEAPRFPKGYPSTVVFTFALWVAVLTGVWYMRRRADKVSTLDVESETGVFAHEEKKSHESGAITPVDEVKHIVLRGDLNI